MNLINILNDIEDDITREEEEASLALERCSAKREVIDSILSRIDLVDEKPSTYKDAERAKAYRALCRRS